MERVVREASKLFPTTVLVLDEPDESGACHTYYLRSGNFAVTGIAFQRGPRADQYSHVGVFDDDLLAIVEHRLAGVQSGPFNCEANEHALHYLREARSALRARAQDRLERGVLRRNEP